MSTELQEEEYSQEDETRFLLFKLVEQTVRDYIALYNAKNKNDQQFYETAQGLLFEKEYFISWGEYELNIDYILSYLDIDKDWFFKRLHILKKQRKKRKKKSVKKYS